MNARLWDGTLLQLGPTAGTQAPFTLVYRHADGVQKMILSNSDPQRLAEAYFRDDFDIEGDLFAALALREHMQTQRKVWHRRARLLFGAIMLPSSVTTESDRQKGFLRQQITTGMHSDAEKPDATTFRYDLSNAFYGLWLDPAMVYSCGYFEQIDDSLEQAQRAKLELICRKLQLHPGEHLLDIGCGWGALILHAAQYHRVHAHGITLSREQLALARERIDAAGLQALVTVECCDYRDLKGQQVYDKIASVGLSEHLGPDNLPLFFDTVHRLLKDSGLFLNQGITQCPDGGATDRVSPPDQSLSLHRRPAGYPGQPCAQDGTGAVGSHRCRITAPSLRPDPAPLGLSPRAAAGACRRICRRTHLPGLAPVNGRQRAGVRGRGTGRLPNRNEPTQRSPQLSAPDPPPLVSRRLLHSEAQRGSGRNAIRSPASRKRRQARSQSTLLGTTKIVSVSTGWRSR